MLKYCRIPWKYALRCIGLRFRSWLYICIFVPSEAALSVGGEFWSYRYNSLFKTDLKASRMWLETRWQLGPVWLLRSNCRRTGDSLWLFTSSWRNSKVQHPEMTRRHKFLSRTPYKSRGNICFLFGGRWPNQRSFWIVIVLPTVQSVLSGIHRECCTHHQRSKTCVWWRPALVTNFRNPGLDRVFPIHSLVKYRTSTRSDRALVQLSSHLTLRK